MAKNLASSPLALDPYYPESRAAECFAVDLIRLCGRLEALMHPLTAAAAAKLISIADAWHANRAEGLTGSPGEIEAALESGLPGADHPAPAAGAAHVAAVLSAQAHLAAGGDPTAVPTLLHREFMGGVGGFRSHSAKAGEYRTFDDGPVPAGSVDGAMGLLLKTISEDGGPVRGVTVLPALYHRIIHARPFPDGNPRVALLVLRSFLERAGVAGGGLWSTSRALPGGGLILARLMEGASAQRWGELDGRGRLSQGGLNELAEWMLKAFRDEAAFMAGLLDRDRLLFRLEAYAARREGIGELEKGSYNLLRESYLRGSFPRGEAGRITGRPERSARRALHALTEDGLLVSDSEKTPVRIAFPVKAAPWLLPGLFPEAAEAAITEIM